MGLFITQGNYTEKALKGLIDTPENREQAVAGLMESVGGKLLQYYITTGEYDFLIVVEGESLTNMVSGLLIAGSTGGVCNLKTVQALTPEEAKTAMEKANAARAGFRPAGTSG